MCVCVVILFPLIGMKTDPLNTSWSVINQSIHQPACFNGGGSCAATVSYKLTCGGDEKKRLWTNMLPHPSGSCGSMKLFHSSVDSFQSRQFAGILTNETKKSWSLDSNFCARASGCYFLLPDSLPPAPPGQLQGHRPGAADHGCLAGFTPGLLVAEQWQRRLPASPCSRPCSVD